MAKSDTSVFKTAAEDTMKAAQGYFMANPAFLPQSRHFWQVQDRVLQEAEKFSTAWFKRRHDATHAALDAAAKIAKDGLNDPAKTAQTIADWQAHSMKRLAEDAKGCAEMMTGCVNSIATHEAEAAKETTETARRVTKTTENTPV